MALIQLSIKDLTKILQKELVIESDEAIVGLSVTYSNKKENHLNIKVKQNQGD